jgi:hypothetical protein
VLAQQQLRSSLKPIAAHTTVSIRSSDGVLFQVNKSNLALSSAGFPPLEFETLDEIVQLTETSTTLRLLFKFCYPECHPDVTTLMYDVLALLAEAAEKYEVYSAMNVCKICMQYVWAVINYGGQ